MIKNFVANTKGNIAVTAALLAVPLVLASGAAIDYTSLARKNSKMQSAVDSALLAVGDKISTHTQAELETEAKNYLKANLPAEHFAEIKKVKLKLNKKQKSARLIVKANHDTTIMRLAGLKQMPYKPTAKVMVSGGNYEIAMVLDSTYSMSADGKMDALKDSATKFVNDLMLFNANGPRIKMGVVPFAKYVNVGTDKAGASWLDTPASETTNQCRTSSPVISKSGCSMQTGYSDGVPYEYEQCSNTTYGDPVETCGEQTQEWNGCVGSRNYPLNLRDESYGTRVPGLLGTYCGNVITPITSDQSTILSAIDNLSPSGDTYIPTGLTWGMRVLSSKQPFQGATSYAQATAKNTTKVVVLMSDGENSRSADLPTNPTHNGSDVDQANDWTLEACEEIEAKGIKVYTIGFGTSISADIATILKKCSTNDDNYYAAVDAKELGEAFDTISKELSALHLSE
jgi:Flp pilus assembly protein TadG